MKFCSPVNVSIAVLDYFVELFIRVKKTFVRFLKKIKMKRLNEDNRTFANFRLVIDDKFVKHTFEIALCNN